MAADGIPDRLEFVADDATLVADGADMTRAGRCDTRTDTAISCPSRTIPCRCPLEGPGTLVGANPFPDAGRSRRGLRKVGAAPGDDSRDGGGARD